MSSQTDEHFDRLERIRTSTGQRTTTGIEDGVLRQFIKNDSSLRSAIDNALETFESLDSSERSLLESDEAELVEMLLKRYVNFYPAESVNPYVPLAASGPWIISTHGAVLHDSGGYGMLGLGHCPKVVNDVISKPWVMANVMTASLSQKRFSDRLLREIGHTQGRCPFTSFICMNSGSEAVTVTSRIVDIHAKKQTDPGAPHSGKSIRTLALKEGFHGRTGFPARLSHSSRVDYERYLASFREDTEVDFIPINDEEAVEEIFELAEGNGIYYQALYIEPVMGEGIPGQAVSRSFYDLARSLTQKHDSLLVVDSIQAAFRAHGCLSIVDYPGFAGCDAPDMETYSKALNGGQYPLSVVALTEKAAGIYRTGVYGNTMTTNPRGLEVGCAVLDSITDETRKNIRERGEELVNKFTNLKTEFPNDISRVVGTGLMVGVLLNPARFTVTGDGGFEQYLRKHGIEMIHGGPNGLRFTPHFNITSEEIDLIVNAVKQGLLETGLQ